MLYALFILGTVVTIALWIYFDSDRPVIRARRSARRSTAENVLSLATNLDSRQLWVALPFPAPQLDPKQYPEGWEHRPRRWKRVLDRESSALVLEGGDRVEALGCEWYVYADADGKALDFSVSGDAEEGQMALPPGIDPESISPSDAQFGDARDPDS